MSEIPLVRVLHHLGRTGGTIISKCLASMQSTVLLSEVHPLGSDRFNPLRQAYEWFDLLSADEVPDNRKMTDDEFVAAIKLIEQRCARQQQRLVLRDWTHLDFMGIPFVDKPSNQLTTSDILSPSFRVLRTATVRHPVDQLLSLYKLKVIQAVWDEAHMLKGIRRFSERAVEIGFLRYEDFVQDADAALKQLCERLQLRFDATYKERWSEYDRITGDSSAPSPKGIQVRPRGQLDPQFLDRLAANEDYRITLELLGYEHPQPLGEHFVAASSVVEIVDASEIHTLFEKGNRLADDKVWEDAVRYYQRVLLRRPNHVWALNNIGFCLLNLKKYDWAILELRRALEMKPDFALALANLIESYEESGRKFEAIPFQRRLVELEPEVANHAFKLSNILVSAGRVPESLHYCRQALALNPKFKAAASNYLLYLNYSDEETPESVSREHMRLAPLWWRPPRLDNAFNQPRDPDRKLRVGYVASDFYTHPVGKIMQPLIAAHASNQIEVHCYYSGKNDDHWTKRTAEASAAFHRVREVGDQDLDQQVFSDQIDILVDLGGYTGGGNRLQVFAARPAPVQISFLGYPNTTGLTAVDYRISDEFCDPPDENDDLFAEQTVRMSRGFLCFSPPDELPPVAALPAKTTGHITFGSFNNVAKVSSSAVGAWAEILRRVPGSRLRFKYGDRFASEWMRERIRSQFAGLGVDPVRLEFLPSMPTLTEHLNAIGGVDLALDSFPYQGTMTTLETLLMGVPAGDALWANVQPTRLVGVADASREGRPGSGQRGTIHRHRR